MTNSGFVAYASKRHLSSRLLVRALTESAFGGGIGNTGTATLNESAVSGNTATVSGGGILNSNGTVTLNDSRVRGNAPDDCVGC